MKAKTPKKYTPICSREQIGILWTPIAKDPANTIGAYARNPNKQLQYKMLDIGAYCIINDIDSEMLELLVRFGNEFKNRFHDMSEADIKKFKEFREYQLFNEDQK